MPFDNTYQIDDYVVILPGSRITLQPNTYTPPKQQAQKPVTQQKIQRPRFTLPQEVERPVVVKEVEHIVQPKVKTLRLILPKQQVQKPVVKEVEPIIKPKIQRPRFTLPQEEEHIVQAKLTLPTQHIEKPLVQPKLQRPRFTLPQEVERPVVVKEAQPVIRPKVQRPQISLPKQHIEKPVVKKVEPVAQPRLQRPRFTLPQEVERPVVIKEEEPGIERKPLKLAFTLPYQDTKVPKSPEDVSINRIAYSIPRRNDLAVLLVFFDYNGSVRILMNYLFMREKLKLANIPVFTLELVMKDSKPKISDAIHVYGSSYLFQKEHLIRLLEKQVPENFTKLACLDADLLFSHPGWYDKLSIILDTSQVVQCFEDAFWLDITYTKVQKNAKTVLQCANSNTGFFGWKTRYHPGFGWAFTRSWYNKIGFYDFAIIGGGDTSFSYGILRCEEPKGHENKLSEKLYNKSYNAWKETRAECFKQYNDITDSLSDKNTDGVYELIDPQVNSNVLNYFKARDDDGID
jgi:hypothetical protein